MNNNDGVMSVSDKQPVVIQTKIKEQAEPKGVPARLVSAQTDKPEIQQKSIEQTQDNRQVLQEKVTKLNKQIQNVRRDLQFTVDDKTGEQIIKVIDVKTKEVIRQIPSEEMLKIRESIDNLKGLLFKGQV